MHKSIYTFFILAAFAVGCWTARSDTTNAALTFYVVSKDKVEGGRFIETPDLPKLGYINAQPDLAVTSLQDVYPQRTREQTELAVKLRAEDAKRFMELTKRASGQRLLVMLGDRLLMAPQVGGPIEGGIFVIYCHGQADLKKTEDELKKLIR
jgi:preprotein translocase subunit SecD